MVVYGTDKATLRVGRLELTKLGWALAVSLALHLLFWGAYAVAKHFDLAAKLHFPKWAQRIMTPPPVQAKPPQPQREPMMFIDVREAQAVAEPPKDATRYSDRNAIAANPDANRDLNEPKIDGEKTELQKTEDAGRKNKFDQLMPDPPKPEAESQPKPKLTPGTMTVAKAELKPPQEKQRPRTIKEAMLQNNQTPGQRAKQDGAAAQRANTSYNVKATGFGAYDRAFIDAVSSRWYNLLDNLSYDGYRQGKVVVQFNLNYKGEITDINVVEHTVSDMLALMCEKAVRDPAPFGEWSREMRLAVGEDSRRITFTFYYN
jgi:outer membrane biosynthesis protein TonB